MNIKDIPMTGPTLVPVARRVYRADLLEAAVFFLSTPSAKEDMEVLVGDEMLRRAAVAVRLGEMAGVFRADAEAAAPSSEFIARARVILSNGDLTPGRKVILLAEVFSGPDAAMPVFGAEAEAARPREGPPPPRPGEAEGVLGEALEALQHITLGQLRAHSISPTLMDRIERAVRR